MEINVVIYYYNVFSFKLVYLGQFGRVPPPLRQG